MNHNDDIKRYLDDLISRVESGSAKLEGIEVFPEPGVLPNDGAGYAKYELTGRQIITLKVFLKGDVRGE